MQGNFSDSIFFFVKVGRVVKSSRAKLSLLSRIPRFTHKVLRRFISISDLLHFMIQKAVMFRQYILSNLNWDRNWKHCAWQREQRNLRHIQKTSLPCWYMVFRSVLYTRNICRAILCQLHISLHIRINEFMHDKLNKWRICNNIVDIETRINNMLLSCFYLLFQWRYLERWPPSIWLQLQWLRWQQRVSSGTTNLPPQPP